MFTRRRWTIQALLVAAGLVVVLGYEAGKMLWRIMG